MPIQKINRVLSACQTSPPNQRQFNHVYRFRLSLIAFSLVAMAAAFGSQADVSPAESSVALYCGIGLMLLGAISAAVELRSRDRRISSVFLAFEAGTFILFTNRRTLVDAQQRQQESDVSSVAGRRAYETISFAAGQTFATVIFLNLKHYLCFQLRS